MGNQLICTVVTFVCLFCSTLFLLGLKTKKDVTCTTADGQQFDAMPGKKAKLFSDKFILLGASNVFKLVPIYHNCHIQKTKKPNQFLNKINTPLKKSLRWVTKSSTTNRWTETTFGVFLTWMMHQDISNLNLLMWNLSKDELQVPLSASTCSHTPKNALLQYQLNVSIHLPWREKLAISLAIFTCE